MRILVGDIGGTNTRLAAYDGCKISELATYKNDEVSNVYDLIRDYTQSRAPYAAVAFGIAGPVVGRQVGMMNRHWVINADEVEQIVKCPTRFLNDFHAQAFGLPALTDNQLVALDDIEFERHGHLALIGAGTGLGEALCIWTGQTWFPVAGEGSHGRFGPQNDRQIKVLMGLRARWPDHVSVERIASGPGILNVYDILRGDAPRHDRLAKGDPSAAITDLALEGSCPIAVETLEIFVDVLADEAASLVLKCNANAVFVSGGIPPRVLPFLKARFRAAFENKGRYRGLMQGVAARVVIEPYLGLIGAGVAGEALVA